MTDGTIAETRGGGDGDFGIDLRRLYSRARSMRFILAALFVGTILIGLIATLLAQPTYRATAEIEISRANSAFIETESSPAEDLQADRQFYTTQYELLESRSLATRVIEAGDLLNNERFVSNFDIEAGTVTKGGLIDLMLEHLQIEPVQDSNLVSVIFESPDPGLSAELANLWANEFIEANFERRFSSNIETQEYLESEIEKQRERLSESEQALVNYANENRIVIVGGDRTEDGGNAAGQSLVGTSLVSLNESLAEATADRIRAEAALRSDFDTNSVGDPAAELRRTLAQKEAELSNVRATYGPRYEKAQSLQAEVDSLQRAVNEVTGRDRTTRGNNLRKQYQAAVARENQLQQRANQVKNDFIEQQGQSIAYGILRREVDTNRELYDGLLQRFKELDAAGAGRNNMILIDAAEVPSSPYSPSLPFNLLISVLLGGFLVGLVVLLREQLDQSLKNTDDVRDRLGLSTLGLIPSIKEKELEEQLGRTSSDLAEAYAATRTNIGFLTTHGAPRSFMVTSTRPNEGKSLTCVALARGFGLLGKKTLLIDADLRNSVMTELIDEADAAKGLSSVLANQATAQECISSVAKYGFDFMPIGHRPPNPSELLASAQMKRLVEQAQTELGYDLVIVDSPPVLGLSDAPQLGSSVEGIIYVIQASSTPYRAVKNSIDRLRKGSNEIYGVILTKAGQADDAYEYAYGYGYGYGRE